MSDTLYANESGSGGAERMAVTESGKEAQLVALGNLCDWLQDNGFRVETKPNASPENDCKWYAYRRLAGEVRDCALNDKPPSLIVLPHLFVLRDRQYSSVEVEITGQVGEPWFRIKAYSIGLDELPAALPEIESSLARAWNALATAAKE
jgi:hypothetical protein